MCSGKITLTVNHTDRGWRRTFESAADIYDSARPRYPKELFDDLVQLAGLEVGDRLLEIGCETGIATRALLQRGFSVVCVEMGAQLAERARETMAGLPAEVHVASFEDWNADPGSFDLVYAATAWHWLEPALRYQKAHRLLRPDGHLAFWSAQHAFPVASIRSLTRSSMSTTRSARVTQASGRRRYLKRCPTSPPRSTRPVSSVMSS